MGQWVKKAELRGRPGYNATGAAADDAAIAAFMAQLSGATATGQFLRNGFAIMAKPPTGVAATDYANLKAAINLLPTTGATVGGKIQLHPGQYLVNGVLPLVSSLHMLGASKAGSEIRVTSGKMFAWDNAIGHVVFEKMILSTISGHIFDLGATGSLYESKFMDMIITAAVPDASLFHSDGNGDFLENLFINCEFNRVTAATVAGFDLRSSKSGINSNTWQNCRAHSHNNTTTPFWKMEAHTGAYLNDNRWISIVGEQNLGGLIHLYSPSGATFENVEEWDGTGNYVGHIFRIDKSPTNGAQPRVITGRNSGTRYGTLAAGVAHFYIPPTLTPSGVILENVGDLTGYSSVINVPNTGRTVVGRGAARSIRTVTANYTIDPTVDSLIITNGPGVNVYLPAPGLVLPGTHFQITNINSAVCGVLSTGGFNVNGAPSQTQAQWVTKTWTSDGTQWVG
jgi:hypothetical protein